MTHVKKPSPPDRREAASSLSSLQRRVLRYFLSLPSRASGRSLRTTEIYKGGRKAPRPSDRIAPRPPGGLVPDASPGERSSRPTRRPADSQHLRGAVVRCGAHSAFVPLLLLPVLPACLLACAPLLVDHRLLLPVHPTRRLPACAPVRVQRYRPLPILYLSLLCRVAHSGIASFYPPRRQPVHCERRSLFVRSEE